MSTMSSSPSKHTERKKQATPAGIGDAFLGKVPPHSTDAELSVIGGVLLHNSTLDVVSDIVRPQDFYSEAHELIFQAILDLHLANRPVDLIHLGEILKDRGELEAVGGLSYLASILDNVPTAANIEAHSRIVAEKAAVRACLGAALDILQKGYGEYGDAETFLDESEQAVFDATRKRSQARLVNIHTALMKTFGEIEELQKAKSDITGVPTGFTALDRLTTGLQPADLIIVAGRPAMGKTALALNIATNAVKQAGTGVVIFSLEMSINQLTRRLLSSEASVSSSKLRVPRRLDTDTDFVQLIQAADRFHKAPIFLDDSAEINVLEIRSRARRLKAKENIGLIIIDYLQIMRPVRASRGDVSREREIAEITRSLKALSKELNVPVVCLSQLNRGPENRQDKRPQLADLRESGAIEQDADLIIFLYREAAYKHTDDNTAEVIVGKNRNGPIGRTKLYFQDEFTRFDNMEQDEIYDSMPGEETRIVTKDQDEPPPFYTPPDEEEEGGGGAPF